MSKSTWRFIGNVVGAVVLLQVLNLNGFWRPFFFLVGLNLFLATRD